MAERKTFPEALTNGSSRNGTNGLYYPSPGDVESEEVSLHEVLEVLFKNKWIILACFVVILVGTAVYTLRQAPEYEAISTVYVNSQQSNPQLGELLGIETFNRNVANEIEIVKSRKIAMRVVEKLVDIERVPGTDRVLSVLGENPSAADQLEVAERLQRDLKVQPVTRGVDIIELRVTSPVPEEAALISTIYAEEYVEYNRELSRSRMTASREFLDDVTDRYSVELQNTEDDLTAFLNRERVVAPDEEARQLLTQLSELQQQQNHARLEMGMVQAEIRTLESEVKRLQPELAQQLPTGDDLIVSRLLERIADLEINIQRRYVRNPVLKDDPSKDTSGELERDIAELASLKSELTERSKNLTPSLENELTALNKVQQSLIEKRVEFNATQARLELLDEQLDRVQSLLRDIPRKEVILSRLNRSRQTTEQLYVTLEEKLQEARIAEQSELGYVDVVDEAIVPRSPVRPRVRLNLLLGAVFGLMLGIGVAFMRNAVDNKVRKPEDLRKRGHGVVGVVPNMDRVIRQDFKGKDRVVVEGHEYSTRLISLLNPLSPVAEGYRRVRTNIEFSRPDVDVRTIMVTSPGPSEGKTVTALNLAITIAQAGRRTLYIDADLRRPQGHRMMGIPREAGLVDLLFDTLPDNMEQFSTDLDSYLYIIPAGRDVPNPAEVLGSRKMKMLLARWSKEFDIVLIDTPPTLLVADSLILASQCDITLVVCSAGETNWQSVDRCMEALDSVGADVIGVLLNRFDPKAAYGGYKYGYGYGYEYGYGEHYYYGPSPQGKQRTRVTR